MSLLLPLLVVLSLPNVLADESSEVWIENEFGERVSSAQLIPNVTMYTLFCKASSMLVSWKMKDRLPDGLSLDYQYGTITGTPQNELPPTEITILAVSFGKTVELNLTLTIAPCTYGSLIYPKFINEATGTLALINNGQVFFNHTLYYRETKRYAICVPHQDYTFLFTCSGSSSYCYFYVEDDKGLVYMNVGIAPSLTKEGTMEMTPTKAPSVFIPSLVTFYEGETVHLSVTITGMYDRVAIEPALPSKLELNDRVGLIRGYVKETSMKEYTLTASNPLGKASTSFTIAVDQCPQGLNLLQLKLARSSGYEYWQVFSSQNELLFDQKNDDRSNTHNVCWTPGTYRFDLGSDYKSPGWYSSSRLSVRDDLGLLAEFRLPDDAFEASRHFTFDYLVPARSEWKVKRGSVDGKWTRVRYNDKKWESGSDGNWGAFSKDVGSVFLRRRFSIVASRFTYIHIDVNRSEDCEVIAYLNEREIGRLVGNSTERTRITLFASSLPSSSVLAVEVRRAASSPDAVPIVFDAKVTATSSGCIIQSVNGVAEDNVHSQPKRAFDLNGNSHWIIRQVPAILRYTFKNAALAINRATLESMRYTLPRSLRVEGVNADNSTVVLYSVSEPFLLHNGFLAMDFNNDQAFASYQFVFDDVDGEPDFYLGDARFYSCSDRQCKRKGGYPVTPTGVTRYGRCPFTTTGTKQMHCVEGDNVAYWSEDRSACVKKMPKKEWAYVDWVFNIDGVTKAEWEKTVQKALVGVLESNMKVIEKEIRFVSVVDVTSRNVTLNVFTRFTLEVEIGDYILKHFKLFEPELNTELAKVAGGVSIATVSMDLREPVNVSTIILICMTIVIVLLASAVIFLVRLRIKSMKKKKSLKHLRGEGMGLLAESV